MKKKGYFKWALLIVFITICALLSVKTAGVKDGFTFTLSLIITIYIIFNGKTNIKMCMYLFIMSMPVLVTARKLFYLDLFVIKLNFESVIILYLFVVNFKQVKLKINELFERYKKLFYFIILFCFSSYISTIFSVDFISSLELTTTSILVPILLGALALSVFNKNDIKKIVYSLIISVNFSCLYGLAQILGIGLNINAIKSSRDMITFGYHNVNIFVNIVLMVFPLLLNELLYKKKTVKENIFLILSAVLQTASIFITFSRGAWLALGLVVILILFSKKYRYVFIAIVVIGVLVSPFTLPKILGRGDSSSHFLENTSNTARVLSIIASKNIMLDNIFGVGYGNFNESYRLNADDAYMSIDYEVRKKMSTPLYTMEHAHNLFLNTGVELGIFAMISILFIFIIEIKNSIRNYSESRGIFVSLMLFIFIGVTTGIQFNHKGVVTNIYILWLLFSMVILLDNKVIDIQ